MSGSNGAFGCTPNAPFNFPITQTPVYAIVLRPSTSTMVAHMHGLGKQAAIDERGDNCERYIEQFSSSAQPVRSSSRRARQLLEPFVFLI